MKNNICFPLLLAAVFIAFTQSGCKENVLIDAGVSPSDNTLGVYDTSMPCITHTFYDDTAYTSLYSSASQIFQAVGAMEDPFFGTMTASTFFQLRAVNPNNVAYKDATIDSAVLILPYSGYAYGDTTDQSVISYQAFFLNEDLNRETIYFSYTDKALDVANPLSEPMAVNMHELQDSLNIGGKLYPQALRIKLKLPVLLSRLLPALDAATNSTDANSAFNSIMKGVSVRVADDRKFAKSMPYFWMGGTSEYGGPGILVYYHPNGSTDDTLKQRYYFSGDVCAFFNRIKRSNSHYPVNSLLTSAAANDSIIAVQNVPGPNIDVVVPGISSLPSGVINKAELRLAVLPWRKDTKYEAVNRLFPIRVNSGTYPAGLTAGTFSQVLDWYSGNNAITFIDGNLHNIDNNGTTVETYTVNIPREVINSLQVGNDTLHLHLTGTGFFTGAYRTILGGGNHPNPLYRAKLFVVYSALNK